MLLRIRFWIEQIKTAIYRPNVKHGSKILTRLFNGVDSFTRGETIIIGGLSSSGKTLFTLTLLKYIHFSNPVRWFHADKSRRINLFFTTEETAEQLLQKVPVEVNMPTSEIVFKKLSTDIIKNGFSHVRKIVEEICHDTHRSLQTVVIDNTQLINQDSNFYREMRQLAVKYNFIVIFTTSLAPEFNNQKLRTTNWFETCEITLLHRRATQEVDKVIFLDIDYKTESLFIRCGKNRVASSVASAMEKISLRNRSVALSL